MPSPFPGMDPWLEDKDLFPDLHASLTTRLQEVINASLPDGYYAATETITWSDPVQRTAPDVTLIGPRRTRIGGSVAFLDAPTALQPLGVKLRPLDWEQPYLEIRTAKGKRVVTAVEFVSRSNKVPGAGRQAYLDKQDEFSLGDVNVVEIDLLRAGPHVTAAPRERLEAIAGGPFHYHVCVTMAGRPERLFGAVFPLTQPLPRHRHPARPRCATSQSGVATAARPRLRCRPLLPARGLRPARRPAAGGRRPGVGRRRPGRERGRVMPSPFPGMDPHIEGSGFFPSFHATFITFLSEALNARLPGGYVSTTNHIVWTEARQKREPDVSLMIGRRTPRPAKRGWGDRGGRTHRGRPPLARPRTRVAGAPPTAPRNPPPGGPPARHGRRGAQPVEQGRRRQRPQGVPQEAAGVPGRAGEHRRVRLPAGRRARDRGPVGEFRSRSTAATPRTTSRSTWRRAAATSGPSTRSGSRSRPPLFRSTPASSRSSSICNRSSTASTTPAATPTCSTTRSPPTRRCRPTTRRGPTAS